MRRLFGERGLLRSFHFAWKGVVWLWKTEPNFRIHFVVGALAIISGFIFGITLLEWIAVSISITTVMAAEAFNTALELLADVAHPGPHDKIGKAKDISAGAVLLVAMAAFAVGGIIFFPKIWALLQYFWQGR